MRVLVDDDAAEAGRADIENTKTPARLVPVLLDTDDRKKEESICY
jgi:hypothetical protein